MSQIGIDFRFLPEAYRQSMASSKSHLQTAYKDLVNKRCKGSQYTGWFDLPKNFGFKLAESVHSSIKQIDVDYDAV